MEKQIYNFDIDYMLSHRSSLKTSPYLSLDFLTEKQKELLWKSFINKADPIEKKFAKDLKKLFRKQKEDVLQRIKDFNPGGRYVSLEDTERFLFIHDDWSEELTEIDRKYVLKAIIAGAEYSERTRKAFDINDIAIIGFLIDKENVFSFQVDTYTLALLKNEFTIAIENQESIPQITKRVEKVFGFSEKYRNVRIARTEIIGAANNGVYQSSIQSGVVWGHRWLAALDGRTRDDHALLGRNQTVAKVGDRFPIANVLYPGDPSGALSQIINCRCSLQALTRKPEGVE